MKASTQGLPDSRAIAAWAHAHDAAALVEHGDCVAGARCRFAKPLAPEVLDDAFSRMTATYDPLRASMLKSTQQSFDEGFLGRTQPNISGLYDLSLLNEVLREKKARPIP